MNNPEIINQFEDNISEPTESTLGKVGKVAITSSALGSWAFQIGPWNEALRIDQATRVLQDTYDSVAVAGRVGLITAGIEITSASLISLGLNSDIGIVERMKDWKKGREFVHDAEDSTEKSKSSRIGGLASDIALSMGGGAGIVTVKHHLNSENNSLAKDMAVSTVATVPVVALSTSVAYLASESVLTAGESDTWFSEAVVNYGTSNKFWLGLLAVGYGSVFVKNEIVNAKNFISDYDGKKSEALVELVKSRYTNIKDFSKKVVNVFRREKKDNNLEQGTELRLTEIQETER